jgi:hypothetical protein
VGNITVYPCTATLAGTYNIYVSNGDGSTVSQSFKLTVQQPPVITQQPANVSANKGQNPSFTVKASGDATIGYQWYCNGVPVANGTAATLTLSNVQTAQAGVYYCVAQNACGTATSSLAMLTVLDPPVITSQPLDGVTEVGATVTLSVAVSGKAPFYYKWTKAGATIAGAVNSSLVIANFSTADVSSYQVTVYNSDGQVTSRAAQLSLPAPVAPTIVSQPHGVKVPTNGLAQCSVTANGTQPLRYQWYENNQPMASQTNGNLVVSANQTVGKTYYATVSNSAGSATSDVITFTLTIPPIILEQPVGGFYEVGSDVSMHVSASGNPVLAYQWYKAGNAIADATNGDYTISMAAQTDSGLYCVTVSNEDGLTTSQTATNVVELKPVLIKSPLSQSVLFGKTLTLDCAFGPETKSCQWYKDNSPISGQTGWTLTRTSVGLGDAGSYFVVGINEVGYATSQVAVVTVLCPPTITSQPQSALVNAGTSTTLQVDATGNGTLAYQWFRNNLAIAGANSSSYTISSLTSDDEGSYYVVVSNDDGSVTSAKAVLTFRQPPVIVVSPQGKTVATGSTVTLDVTATGTAPLVYQWLFNGLPLAGANSRILTLANIQTNNAGNYSVLVTNAVGSAISSEAVTAVKVAPLITRQPSPTLDVLFNGPVQLSVDVSGDVPMTFQWYRNNSPLVGQNQISLDIASLQMSDQGTYKIMVSNEVGFAVSSNCVLQVCVPPTIVVPPANARAKAGATATFQATVSGTAPLYYAWLKSGQIVKSGYDQPLLQLTTSTNTAGSYSLMVSNLAGVASVDNVTLTLIHPPAIFQQPSNITANQGANVILAVYATSTTTVHYQWMRNGVALPGMNQAQLMFSNIQPEHEGSYRVILTNAEGDTTSQDATITINPLAVIVTQPVSQILTITNKLTLAIKATSPSAMTYQWYFNGQPIPNATDSTYVVNSAQMSQDGEYFVTVRNSAGTVMSEPVLAIVLPPQPIRKFTDQVAGQFLLTAVRKDIVGLQFYGAPGRTYTIQSSTNMADWQDVSQVTMTNNTSQFFDKNTEQMKFYRIVTPNN